MQKELDELVERLKASAMTNLKAVVWYGSAVTGEYHAGHSDLNVLCLLEHVGAAELEGLHPVAAWWMRRGHPAPLVFTLEELHRSADIFAIELLDIRTHHIMLYGEDFWKGFEVPMTLHRLQVERELRTNWLRLRQGILGAPRKRGALIRLMTASVSSFAALFRHALIVLGEPPLVGRRLVLDRLAKLVGADPGPFETVLDLRAGKKKEGQVDATATLRGYLEFVERITDEVDRRLAGEV